MSPKPPDILRKSHRHTERKERATAKEQLRQETAVVAAELGAWNCYVGVCHCGAVGYRYTTNIPPAEWSVRACQCSYCRDHDASYTSDPAGSVELVAEPDALDRERFAMQLADFLICRRCGDLVAAIATTDRGKRAAVNLRLLRDLPPDLPAGEAIDYETETAEQRRRRQEAQWTPVEEPPPTDRRRP